MEACWHKLVLPVGILVLLQFVLRFVFRFALHLVHHFVYHFVMHRLVPGSQLLKHFGSEVRKLIRTSAAYFLKVLEPEEY